MHLVIGFIIGGLIGFFIAAVLASGTKETSYAEDFLLSELYSFKHYWIENLESKHDQEVVEDVIDDFILGLMNGFRRED